MDGELTADAGEVEESALDRLARETGDPELFPAEVCRLWEQGKGRKARKALLRAAKSERRQDRARQQVQHAGDFRLWLEPLGKAPGMYTLNGVGSHLYGKYQPENDGSYIATLWFVFVFIPIWPFSSYLVTKAESGGWHFFARSPRPPAAKMMQRLVIAAFVAVAGLGAMAAYDSGTHADVLVYNGYDQPVDVALAEETQRVGPKNHATFADLVAGPTRFAAGFAGSEAFESLDVDLSSHARDTVIYNVGGRGLLSLDYVRYGRGEPKEGRWLEGGPVLFLKEDLDYLFREPPESKEIREGSYVENSVLSAADQDFDELTLVSILASQGSLDQARQFGLAVLRAHPENAQVAMIVAQATMDDPEEQRRLFRGLMEQVPDAVDLHRYYQGLWPDDDNQPVLDEYFARLEADPGSAMNQYLVGRLLPDEESLEYYAEAIRLDPELDAPHRALGYQWAQRGSYAEAQRHYETFASFGDAQTFEALDPRTRLHRAMGSDAASVDALLVEALAVSEMALQLEGQRRHLRLEQDPTQLSAVIEEFEALGDEWFGYPKGGQEMAAARADLAITAGDLERARAEVESFRQGGDPAYWVELRLALSDGAGPSDVERLMAGGPEWTSFLTDVQSLAGLGFMSDDDRNAHVSSLQDPAVADFARLLTQPATLRDVGTIRDAVLQMYFVDRCAAYMAAAQALKGQGDVAARKARSVYLDRARRLSIPGEMPFVRL